MSYENQLKHQVENAKTPTSKEFLTGLYSELSKEIEISGEYLEIGAGAGISSIFLDRYNVTRTDILPWGNGLVVGGVNAEEIPYEDGVFDGVFGMDMLHHMEYPYRVINDCMRVTKEKGKVIFIEPYVSLLSFSVYRIFHTEKTSIWKRVSPKKPAIGSLPEDGDQRMCQSIFLSRQGLRHLRNETNRNYSIEKRFIHPFSFFSTGGLSRPLKTKPEIIRRIQVLEQKLPNWLLRLTASRIVVVITLEN